jgi:hypothetical protein
MRPTSDQVQVAAYHLWERRGGVHGRDRQDWLDAEKEVAFRLNYRTIADYALDASPRIVIGDGRPPQCRFCERAAARAEFHEPRPVIAGLPCSSALFSAEVCDECYTESLEPLALPLQSFWTGVQAMIADPGRPGRVGFSIAAFKALVSSAMLILPRGELANFSDTLEWVINPDHDYDGGLFSGTVCHAYDRVASSGRPWVSLARRTDDEAALPYAVFVIFDGRTAAQVALPLCACDQDLDGRLISMPGDPRVAGSCDHHDEAPCFLLDLADNSRPARRDGSQRPIAC